MRYIQDQLYEVTGVWVHSPIICRTIKEHRFTRKRLRRIAIQQSKQLRIQFMADISMYDPDMLIWIRQDQQEEIASGSTDTHSEACQLEFINYK